MSKRRFGSADRVSHDVMSETNGAAVEDGPSLDDLDIPVLQSGNALTLDNAVARLMQELDPDHQRIIHECSAETGQPPSAYILSALRLSHERGEMSQLDKASMVEPEAGPLPAVVHCAWCHQEFTPTAKGQYLCPTPAPGQDSCARQQALDQQRKKRASRYHGTDVA